MDYFRVRRLAALAGARAAVHRTADEAAEFLDNYFVGYFRRQTRKFAPSVVVVLYQIMKEN
jgi:hypothetical protein